MLPQPAACPAAALPADRPSAPVDPSAFAATPLRRAPFDHLVMPDFVGGHDLEDMVAEVPPLAGTLVAFRRTDRSWHGHHPFEGPRRCIMFHWMVDAAAARRETRRDALSAGMKQFVAAVRGGAGS